MVKFLVENIYSCFIGSWRSSLERAQAEIPS